MTKIYLFGCFLGVASIASAQNFNIKEHSPNNYLRNNTKHRTHQTPQSKGDGSAIIYWSEDFSEGLDGQGDNGAWSDGEEYGDLWFVTYPPEATNGYNPDVPLEDASPNYADQLPNWFTGTDILESPSRDNGIMMIDADRFNSTATVGNTEPPTDHTLTNSFAASLISPPFDLTGVTAAELSYWHSSRFCCAVDDYALSVEFSIDNGDSWIPFDGYTDYAQFDGESTQINIVISDILQDATDLTECRIKFFWNGLQSHYFWMIDDVAIISPPENDLAAIRGWYGDHHKYSESVFSEDSEVDAVGYYNSFEYLMTPDHYYENRPLKFALAVKNNGTETQTGVKMIVTTVAPDGSDGPTWDDGETVSIDPGQTDTLIMPEKFLTEITPTLEAGNYTFNYEVVQNEIDERPNDNTGIVRGTNISVETEANNYYTTYRNGENSYGGSYPTDGQDRIFGTAYVFPNDVASKVITHVETVFLFDEDFAETQAGEVVFFNVREGSVFEEDEDPESITTVFFDEDNPLFYEQSDLEYTIEEEDIWHSADGFPFIWTSFELPSPILVEAGKVYQAEFRIPTAGGNVVFNPSPDGEQEEFSSFMYDPSDGWFFLADNAQPIRFRMNDEATVGLETVTIESGITLLQNYPNPFSDETRIQYSLDETQEASIEIHDLAGKLIISENLGMVSAGSANSYLLDGTALSAGIYTYSIVTPNTKVTRKLTVQ